jgi:hypothetical protein
MGYPDAAFIADDAKPRRDGNASLVYDVGFYAAA